MNIRYSTYEGRKKLEELYSAGTEINEIAKILKVSFTTVYRELNCGKVEGLDKNGRQPYSADVGQQTLNRNFRNRGTRVKRNKNPQEK